MAEAMPPTPAAEETGPPGEDIKPYRIHVSSKYLDLTKQKLELTRLPHEGAEPKSTLWWEPKPQVEPLIDFWLERYSWRDHERRLNEALPQFRTAFHLADVANPLRVHFIHVRSRHDAAVPLLLIPPFPFTNLSLGHLFPALTDPDDPATTQPFHLVMPSLPGLGFSDALPNNVAAVPAAAELFNSLMIRLGYDRYLASNTAPSCTSPAHIDYQLATHLAEHYASSCVATHLIAPPLRPPIASGALLEFLKWMLAQLFTATLFGYTEDDFAALQRSRAAAAARRKTEGGAVDSTIGLREPNTLTYALCDSPVGLLVFVIMILRILGPTQELTPAEMLTLTQLAWLPGPEAALRFWAQCATPSEPKSGKKRESSSRKTKPARPKVAITVFLGIPKAAAPKADDVEAQVAPYPTLVGYACPAWARAKYDVLWSHRALGNPGLLVWERPEIIVNGARELAKAAGTFGAKLRAGEGKEAAAATTEPLRQVVVMPPSDGSNNSGPLAPSGEPKEKKEVKFAAEEGSAKEEKKELSPPTTTTDPEGEGEGSRERDVPKTEREKEKEPEEKETEKQKSVTKSAEQPADVQLLQPPPQVGKPRTDSPDVADLEQGSPATIVAAEEGSPSPMS